MGDMTISEQILPVPAGQIAYRVQGRGPALLLLSGGEGDRDRSQPLAAQLASCYTVITHDRRGLSASADPADPQPPASMERHAADLEALLEQLDLGPAFVFGSSFGAHLGMLLATRTAIRALLAHEPAVISLLSEDEQRDIRERLAEIRATAAADGVVAAMRLTAHAVGLDPDAISAEGATTPVKVKLDDPTRGRNLRFFLDNDLAALMDSPLTPDQIAEIAVPVIPAGGETSRQVWNYRCAQHLSELRAEPVVEFAGGHNGPNTHPTATAERIVEVFGRVSAASAV